jgi:CubicO group peptidase (beta-lactamase class C family)
MRRCFLTAATVFAALLCGCAHAPRVGKPEVGLAGSGVDSHLTLANGARFIAPNGWTIRVDAAAIILGAPEGDSHVVIADGGTGGADAAAAAAWEIYKPGTSPSATGVARPAREGWDETLLYRYETPVDEARNLFALAMRKHENWTVLIHDVADSVAERRDGQIEIVFNSLLPKGYARETLAGRKAHRLDAERIAALVEFVELARKELDIPGVALGLIDDGEVVFEGGFGVREVGKPEPVDHGTLFNIASNGKAMTTLMLAKLVEQRRFDWEKPVADIWPAFRLGDAETTRRVKVKHLVCACTGMPRQDFEWTFEGDGAYSTASAVMELLSNSAPTSEFGEIYQYSNLMAAAAGYFGGHVVNPGMELGAAYDAAMQSLVFDPLGMTATTADFDRALKSNHASGHAPGPDGAAAVASQGINLAAISTRPSGNHWSNVRDMLRFVQLELGKGRLPGGRRVIGQAALLARRAPQVTEGLNEYYGMGLKIDRQWGVEIIHHGGSASGYRSDMMWLSDYGVGAVILANSDSGGLLRSAFRRRLQEVLFDGAPKAVDTIKTMGRRIRAAAAEERAALTVPADSVAAARLAPRYYSDKLGALEITQRNGATWFDFGGWESEAATISDADGSVRFVTISPGVEGFEFSPAGHTGARRLVIRDAQHEYVFREQ